MEQKLYSWQDGWEYRFSDEFPSLSNQGRLAVAAGNIVAMDPDGSNQTVVLSSRTQVPIPGNTSSISGQALQPTWSPDGEWVSFGVGAFFWSWSQSTAVIVRATSNGTFFESLTDGSVNSGLPNYSADGRYIVYREWGDRYGLRLIDLDDKSIASLTTTDENLPYFSSDGTKVVLTRHVDGVNYDVVTINPDGTGERMAREKQRLLTAWRTTARPVDTARSHSMYVGTLTCYDSSLSHANHVLQTTVVCMASRTRPPCTTTHSSRMG
jgi:Tol biopolymer transport system component